jgi:gluconate 2-dehydrogenase gamma chain
MQPADPAKNKHSRRAFLQSSGAVIGSAWIAAHWPAIAAAAHHAEDSASSPEPKGFEFFEPEEAADVDAIASQIVPSGATPGAHEANVVYFIDRAVSTFFAFSSADFRPQLTEFRGKFRAAQPTSASFAKATSDAQIAYLKTVDDTPFFETMRTLTLLGMLASPKYGGNYHGSGWKMMGFVDQHAFQPPFGYYDREYTGFVPYSAKEPA